MYIALFLIIVGIATGRLARPLLNGPYLGRAVFCGVLCLLFLLGAEIGGNALLFANLPMFGLKALGIALCSLAGSIICARRLQLWLERRGHLQK